MGNVLEKILNIQKSVDEFNCKLYNFVILVITPWFR